MKVIMVMFDSLNRHMLPPYGPTWVHAPNFERLARRTATFDRSYVCSMPCMPARRDLHTGRPNFLHRSWGPLEPFDDSVPNMLRQQGVSTHLITDHYHYFEAGGATYHSNYSTWQFYRGQEGDPWMGQVARPNHPQSLNADSVWHQQDWINRSFMTREEEMPQARTFDAGIDFIRRNHAQDRWMLHLETFDPHEPFFSHRKYKDLYPEHYRDYRGPHWDWPKYQTVQEPPELVEHMRHEYASLVSMCDAKLGDLLDTMDQLDLWKDTMLIVWTDHGFLLSEHDSWAKVWTPFYEEVAHTPFFVWDPRCPQAAGQRRSALVQPSIDLGPTLLDFFGLPLTPDMRGRSLTQAIASDAPVRDAAIFGLHGGQLNVTDGRYVYMRSTPTERNEPLYNYTLMPTHMRAPFGVSELAGRIELAEPFRFTKGCRTMRIPAGGSWQRRWSTVLYDLQADPRQERPIDNAAVERQMIDHMVRLMRDCDAPPEQYQRLGLPAPGA